MMSDLLMDQLAVKVIAVAKKKSIFSLDNQGLI